MISCIFVKTIALKAAFLPSQLEALVVPSIPSSYSVLPYLCRLHQWIRFKAHTLTLLNFSKEAGILLWGNDENWTRAVRHTRLDPTFAIANYAQGAVKKSLTSETGHQFWHPWKKPECLYWETEEEGNCNYDHHIVLNCHHKVIQLWFKFIKLNLSLLGRFVASVNRPNHWFWLQACPSCMKPALIARSDSLGLIYTFLQVLLISLYNWRSAFVFEVDIHYDYSIL